MQFSLTNEIYVEVTRVISMRKQLKASAQFVSLPPPTSVVLKNLAEQILGQFGDMEISLSRAAPALHGTCRINKK